MRARESLRPATLFLKRGNHSGQEKVLRESRKNRKIRASLRSLTMIFKLRSFDATSLPPRAGKTAFKTRQAPVMKLALLRVLQKTSEKCTRLCRINEKPASCARRMRARCCVRYFARLQKHNGGQLFEYSQQYLSPDCRGAGAWKEQQVCMPKHKVVFTANGIIGMINSSLSDWT